MLFIKNFHDGAHVLGHYFVRRKEERESRVGKPFLSLVLQDKTGTADAKVWDITSNIRDVSEGEMAKIEARIVSYQGALQLKVTKMRKSREDEYDPADYVLSTPKDIGVMYDAVIALIASISCPHIRELLQNVYTGSLQEKIKNHAAAMHMHHAYVGGLLEHTLTVTEICDAIWDKYRHVNRDILLAGALLHDIGKLFELAPPPAASYTDDGQMLGHIMLGARLLSDMAKDVPKLTHEQVSLITHCILAHHGEYEFGSPKLPMTQEAMLLHFADNIDAKLTSFADAIDADQGHGLWTNYQKSLGRYLRKPR